jgi:hypothetical protein
MAFLEDVHSSYRSTLSTTSKHQRPDELRRLVNDVDGNGDDDGADFREDIEERQQLIAMQYVVRCAFSNRILHSRMPLDPTHVRLKQTCVCPLAFLSGVHCSYRCHHKSCPNTEGSVPLYRHLCA